MRYIYTMEYYSAMKNDIMPFAASWMDLEIIIVNEVNQAENDKYNVTYMWNLKNDTNELISKTERNPQTLKKLMVNKGERGRDKLGVSD